MVGRSEYIVLVVCFILLVNVAKKFTNWTDSFELTASNTAGQIKHYGNDLYGKLIGGNVHYYRYRKRDSAVNGTYRYVHPTSQQRGKPISVAAQKAFNSLNNNLSTNLLEELRDDIADTFVFVTAATSDHFQAAHTESFPRKENLLL